MRQFMLQRASFIVKAASLLLVSSLSLAEVSVVTEGGKSITKVHVDGVTFQKETLNQQDFQTAKLQGVSGYEAVQFEVGRPEVPVVRFYTLGNVTVQHNQPMNKGAFKSGLKLKPNQASLAKMPNQTAVFAMDQQYYKTQKKTIAAYTVEEAGSVNGQTRFLVTLFPFQYNPAESSWSFVSDFTVSADASEEPKDETGVFAFVVGAKFKNDSNLMAYAHLKEELGFKTAFIDVTAQDTADTVRTKIKDLYARSTNPRLKYALIIGDVADVPSHVSDIITGVTDHYYRAIDTNDYKKDINGPDIELGRVAVSNAHELAVVLDKFTRYMKGGFTENTWLTNATFIATDDRYTVAEGSHNYAIDKYTAPKGYIGAFPERNQKGGDKLYAITHHAKPANVVDALKDGRAIVNYSGHGGPDRWVGPEVLQSDVRSLSDANALPFVVSNACNTADFRTDESFGETWLRHDAGAIFFWGSMDSSYWDEDDVLEKAMYDGIYRDGRSKFGDITHYALSEVWRTYGGKERSAYYWETYVSLGDPSIDLRKSVN